MEEIVTTKINPVKIEACDPFPVQTANTMEELEQSSLEEKVDLGNLVLFPPESRGVVPRGVMAPPDFDRSVNP